MATIKVNFEYNEPRFGQIEVTGGRDFLEKEYDFSFQYLDEQEGSEFKQNMLDKIVAMYPEAIDIEITKVEYID
jgi:hypothetical protein